MMYGRFAAGLPEFLRQRMSTQTAAAILAERLRSRENNLLSTLERCVFRHAASPYLFILREAGCEPGDVRSLVMKEGVDNALIALERAGVRVTFEEFKGRTPLVRNGKTFDTSDTSFDNPLGRRSITSQTSGSTGKPTRVNMELDHIADMTAGRIMAQVANGVFGQPTIMYRAGLPSTAAIGNILTHIVMGNPVRRWISPVSSREIAAPVRFRIAGSIIPLIARASGTVFPRMEVVPVSEAARVARMAHELAADEGRCLVRCAVSTSLSVATAALENGIDLSGVTFMGAAEPPTPAKLRGIRRSGAAYVSNYAMNEAGMVGAGCPNGSDDTDVHVWQDRIALVPGSRRPDSDDGRRVSFAVTSLMTSAPKVMLNVDIDDNGLLERRNCGCGLGALGFDQHVRQISSSAKLTGRGVTLVGSDIVRVIEEILPGTFGGNSQDYQLVEEEAANGQTMLTLLINPSITIDDERAPATLLYDSLAGGRPGASFSGAILKGSDAVRVRRVKPLPNARGKQPAFLISNSSL